MSKIIDEESEKHTGAAFLNVNNLSIRKSSFINLGADNSLEG